MRYIYAFYSKNQLQFLAVFIRITVTKYNGSSSHSFISWMRMFFSFLNFCTLIKFFYIIYSFQFNSFFHHSTHLMTHSALDLIICNRDVLIHRFLFFFFLYMYICMVWHGRQSIKTYGVVHKWCHTCLSLFKASILHLWLRILWKTRFVDSKIPNN